MIIIAVEAFDDCSTQAHKCVRTWGSKVKRLALHRQVWRLIQHQNTCCQVCVLML